MHLDHICTHLMCSSSFSPPTTPSSELHVLCILSLSHKPLFPIRTAIVHMGVGFAIP